MISRTRKIRVLTAAVAVTTLVFATPLAASADEITPVEETAVAAPVETPSEPLAEEPAAPVVEETIPVEAPAAPVVEAPAPEVAPVVEEAPAPAVEVPPSAPVEETAAAAAAPAQVAFEETAPVTIQSVEGRLTAVDDYVPAQPGQQISIYPLANDLYDGAPKGDLILMNHSLTSVHGGQIRQGADALNYELNYTAPVGFEGQDSFTYEVYTYPLDEWATGTVYVNVGKPNTAPKIFYTAVPYVVAGEKDLELRIDVNDADGDEVTLSAGQAPSNGALYVTNARVAYTPNDGFSGIDTFSIVATDTHGATDERLITMNVLPAANGVSEETTPVNTPQTFELESNHEGHPIEDVFFTAEPSSGTVEFIKDSTQYGRMAARAMSFSIMGAPSTGAKIIYTPNEGFVGTDTFTYSVCYTDGFCTTDAVTVKVTKPVVIDPTPNRAPVVEHEVTSSQFIKVGESLTIEVNTFDPDGDEVLFTAAASARGDLKVTSKAGSHSKYTVVYTAKSGSAGTVDTITLTGSDESDALDSKTVKVYIQPDAAGVVDDVTPVNTSTSFEVTPSTTGEAVSDVIFVTLPKNGKVEYVGGSASSQSFGARSMMVSLAALPAAQGRVVYTPNPGFVGVDTFSYMVVYADGAVETLNASVEVEAAAVIPTVPGDTTTIPALPGAAVVVDEARADEVVTVNAATPQMAVTGSDPAPLGALSALLLVGGGLLLAIRHRRQVAPARR